MFRSPAFRRQLAVLLLLLFGRVLAPESVVLALHAHTHTRDEPVQAAAGARQGKALISPQHQHCHVDQLYQVPALLASPVVVPQPVRRAVFTRLVVPRVLGLPVASRCERAGRGPPQA